MTPKRDDDPPAQRKADQHVVTSAAAVKDQAAAGTSKTSPKRPRVEGPEEVRSERDALRNALAAKEADHERDRAALVALQEKMERMEAMVTALAERQPVTAVAGAAEPSGTAQPKPTENVALTPVEPARDQAAPTALKPAASEGGRGEGRPPCLGL